MSPANRTPDPSASWPQYEIRLGGRLAPRWSDWFDGMSVVGDEDGTTVLRGPVVDQAALHGLIQKLRDIGIPLLSLTRLEAVPPSRQPIHKEH